MAGNWRPNYIVTATPLLYLFLGLFISMKSLGCHFLVVWGYYLIPFPGWKNVMIAVSFLMLGWSLCSRLRHEWQKVLCKEMKFVGGSILYMYAAFTVC